LTENTKKGRVEFQQPPVKLVAEMPGDEEMRQDLDEMKMNDGYQGSCRINNSEKED
jgi:hypothetical protein